MPVKFSIGQSGSIAKKQTTTNSYVSLCVNGKTIYMASKNYHCKAKDAIKFYKEQHIHLGANVNLLTYDIAHGTAEDKPETTLPEFYRAAKDMRLHLTQAGDRVLVNCNHGRSRTGTVVALYLILIEKLSADDAINLVNSALRRRGILNGIDLSNAINGSYGEWLREMEASCSNTDDAEKYFAIMHQSPNFKKTIAMRNETDLSELLEETSNVALELLDDASSAGPGF